MAALRRGQSADLQRSARGARNGPSGRPCRKVEHQRRHRGRFRAEIVLNYEQELRRSAVGCGTAHFRRERILFAQVVRSPRQELRRSAVGCGASHFGREWLLRAQIVCDPQPELRWPTVVLGPAHFRQRRILVATRLLGTEPELLCAAVVRRRFRLLRRPRERWLQLLGRPLWRRWRRASSVTVRDHGGRRKAALKTVDGSI